MKQMIFGYNFGKLSVAIVEQGDWAGAVIAKDAPCPRRGPNSQADTAHDKGARMVDQETTCRDGRDLDQRPGTKVTERETRSDMHDGGEISVRTHPKPLGTS